MDLGYACAWGSCKRGLIRICLLVNFRLYQLERKKVLVSAVGVYVGTSKDNVLCFCWFFLPTLYLCVSAAIESTVSLDTVWIYKKEQQQTLQRRNPLGIKVWWIQLNLTDTCKKYMAIVRRCQYVYTSPKEDAIFWYCAVLQHLSARALGQGEGLYCPQSHCTLRAMILSPFLPIFPTYVFYKKIWDGNPMCLIPDVLTRNTEFIYSNTHVFMGNSHKHMHSAFFLPSLPYTPTKERQNKKSPTCFSQREPVLELSSLQRSSIICKEVICFVKNCSSCLHGSWNPIIKALQHHSKLWSFLPYLCALISNYTAFCFIRKDEHCFVRSLTYF